MSDWLILTATLPTRPSGLRVRVWRALKATGAASLRDGVYLLPEHAPTAAALRELERSIVEAGAQAYLLELPARDAPQEAAFRALFNRDDLYAELQQSMRAARSAIGRAGEAELHKSLRTLEHSLQAIRAGDFFPGPSALQAEQDLRALRGEVERQLSPGEPQAGSAAILPRAIAEHQGRTWATRRRPWVDRLACAWLVQRFIDRSPRFLWLQDAAQCPAEALGFDFDGASFSHVGDRVSFEVMAESFGLLQDPALHRLAALVHGIDVGGAPQDEAAGFEMLVRGLQACHADDDALLRAACPLFDAAYAAQGTADGP